MRKFDLYEKESLGSYQQYIKIDEDKAQYSYVHEGRAHIFDLDETTKRLIKDCSLKDISNYLYQITFDEKNEALECKIHVAFYLKVGSLIHPTLYRPPFIFISPTFNFRYWSKSYSGYQLQVKFEEIASNYPNVEFTNDDDQPHPYFGLNIRTDLKFTIGEVLEPALNVFSEIFVKAVNALEETRDGQLSSYFNFPLEIKTACIQYLTYFGQFLADLGINANTTLKEKAHEVLFTIIPEDGNEALEKIKHALDLFISAPENPFFNSENIDGFNDIAVSQWEANIHHLKSQLLLASAVIETKNATIEALRLSNYKLQEVSLPTNKKDNLDEEKIIGGLFSIKKYEGKGFAIDLPALFRLLKRKKKNT